MPEGEEPGVRRGFRSTWGDFQLMGRSKKYARRLAAVPYGRGYILFRLRVNDPCRTEMAARFLKQNC